MIEQETFWTLLHDPAHWAFELFVGFDGLVGLVLWPKIRRHWQHHKERDEREKV